MEGEPDHAMVPVYSAVETTVERGVSPATGGITPRIEAISMVERFVVRGKTTVIRPEFALFEFDVAPAALKKLDAMPAKVKPLFAVSVTVAVSISPYPKVLGEPNHETVPVY